MQIHTEAPDHGLKTLFDASGETEDQDDQDEAEGSEGEGERDDRKTETIAQEFTSLQVAESAATAARIVRSVCVGIPLLLGGATVHGADRNAVLQTTLLLGLLTSIALIGQRLLACLQEKLHQDIEETKRRIRSHVQQHCSLIDRAQYDELGLEESSLSFPEQDADTTPLPNMPVVVRMLEGAQQLATAVMALLRG